MPDKEANGATDSRLLLISPDDNVYIACTTIPVGTALEIEGQNVTMAVELVLGHKLARYAMAAGDKVVKWGAPIGSLSSAVPVGGHVHVHNMQSDYIPTYTAQEGHRFLGGDAS